jgi:transcriptional regulator GlxA family with amidase domain
VDLDPSVLYMDEGRVVTSAGIAASLDCCLHLLRKWCGAELANRLARRLVLAPHRRGGQAQFIEQPLPPPGPDARIEVLLNWMLAHIHQRLDLDALAQRVSMSRRTFTRQFQRATGSSVMQWLTHQRLTLAGRLLETTDRPVESIAANAGFGSALSLRQHFAALYGVSPAAYRRQYRPTADVRRQSAP